MYSSIHSSTTEFQSHYGESVYENNESVDYIEAQIYDSGCCGSSFLNFLLYGSNLILTSSNEILSDVLGKCIHTDCDPCFDEENEGAAAARCE